MEHRVVSHQEWVEARRRHLADEKRFTRERDALSQARRDLPWERVEKDYVFEGPHGKRSLGDLFDGRGQLVIYHAMFNPETATGRTSWTRDAACPACSFWMDNFERIVVHLNHRDITMAAISMAPLPAIEAYRKRMGWTFPWYSSDGSDFNFDYHVSFDAEQMESGRVDYNFRIEAVGQSESPGVSVFLRDGGPIYHTYTTYARGLDMLNVAYHYMDLVPKGRDEGAANGMSWLHRRDEYPA
ncbi:MAG TPA: DUF899 domain-containing protein [Candidatus Dormibacteraeota bacterium]|nr:DUF899 domain-containing protein [Candidatus Dormibacteraeota bacterium]